MGQHPENDISQPSSSTLQELTSISKGERSNLKRAKQGGGGGGGTSQSFSEFMRSAELNLRRLGGGGVVF